MSHINADTPHYLMGVYAKINNGAIKYWNKY